MQFEYFNARLLQNTALKIKQTVGAVTPPAGYAFGVLSALTNLEITNSDLVENVNSVYVNTLDIKIPTEETMAEYVEYVFEHDAAKRDSVIIKSNTIPAASAELLGYEYQYMGETNNTYTHGFVYVCKGIPTDTLVFTPNTVSCDWANLSAFLQTETADYNSVVAGSMTYFADAELWRATFTDANGDTVLTYQQYTGDWEDVGFVFSQTFEDGDVVSFVRHTEFDYVWERVDLQPNHEQDVAELQADVAEIQSVIPAQASASNQLADKNYVQSGLDEKQDTLTATDGINLNNNVISGKPLQDDIADINALIPGQASTSNQLADKNFVNSSISTNTANFIGTFNSVADLESYSGTLTNNDYAFVVKTDSAGNTYYDRYKYTTATTPASWIFEYELNNSSFTASQWAAINSGATSSNIAQIDTNKTNITNHIANTNNPHSVTKAQVGLGNVDNTSDLNKPISTATQTALNGKQATISDLATIRSNAQAGKAASDTIATYGDIVTHNVSEFATAAQGAKADTAVQPGDLGNGTITIRQGGVTKGTFTTNQSGDTTVDLDAGGGSSINPGFVAAFAGSTAPSGWLVCDGSAISRDDYADLFTAIGITYGSGDGSTTFNLPDLSDCFVQGGTAGTTHTAGLPNITGSFLPYANRGAIWSNSGSVSGVFKRGGYVAGTPQTAGSGGGQALDFDASGSNSIYGNSDTVQPKSVEMMFCIKY